MWINTLSRFLGSMSLAVTLLVVIAVASIIGTVIAQNLPYTNYIIQFGPFWHEVFTFIGLYDVYSSIWFIALLGFLVISISICLYRNTPEILRGMRRYNVSIQADSLRRFRHVKEWVLSSYVSVDTLGALLRCHGYRWRSKQSAHQVVVAAKKGTIGRLGYLFTHTAMVLICLGALFDSNIPLKFAVITGKVQVETRPILADQVPAVSRLSPTNMSFRATLDISEQTVENLAYINYREGYLIQPLPFTIGLSDFYMEYYANGQPKSYKSKLVISDETLAEPLRKTVSVNHPLNYKGYNIYQAGFGDGGSVLDLRVYPLDGSALNVESLQGVVGEQFEITTLKGRVTVELLDFRPFNVKLVRQAMSDKKFKNLGPSFTFRLRNPDGMAKEYINYMSTMEIAGRSYFVSGMRENKNASWRHLYIPVDARGGIISFLQLLDNSRDNEILDRVFRRYAAGIDDGGKILTPEQLKSMRLIMAIFNKGGFAALERYLADNVPAEQRKKKRAVFFQIIQNMLEVLYLDVLQTEYRVDGRVVDKEFIRAAANALGHINQYGSPFYFRLTGFEHREASSLEISRSPGKNIVYLGFGLLVAGIFMMFYISFNRIWILVWPENGRYRLLLAGVPNRQSREFEQKFRTLQAEIATHLSAVDKL